MPGGVGPRFQHFHRLFIPKVRGSKSQVWASRTSHPRLHPSQRLGRWALSVQRSDLQVESIGLPVDELTKYRLPLASKQASMSQNRTEGNPCRHACHFRGLARIYMSYPYVHLYPYGIQILTKSSSCLWCRGQQRLQRATSMDANAIRHRIRASVQVSRVDAYNAPNCGKIAITILPWDMIYWAILPAQGGWLCMVPRPLRSETKLNITPAGAIHDQSAHQHHLPFSDISKLPTGRWDVLVFKCFLWRDGNPRRSTAGEFVMLGRWVMYVCKSFARQHGNGLFFQLLRRYLELLPMQHSQSPGTRPPASTISARNCAVNSPIHQQPLDVNLRYISEKRNENKRRGSCS